MSYASEFAECWTRTHSSDVHQIDSEWVIINRTGHNDSDAPWLCHCCYSTEGPEDFAIIVNVQAGETYRTTNKMKKCSRCNAKPTNEIMAVYRLLTLFEYGRRD
jgi:hypothetical protein